MAHPDKRMPASGGVRNARIAVNRGDGPRHGWLILEGLAGRRGGPGVVLGAFRFMASILWMSPRHLWPDRRPADAA